MSTNYRLTDVKDGEVSSKTYEFGRIDPKQVKKGDAKRKPRSGSRLNSASSIAKKNIQKEMSDSRNEPDYLKHSRPSGKTVTYHLESRKQNKTLEKTYEMDVYMQAPQRIQSRYKSNEKEYKGHYVTDKNGRRVFAKTKADAISISRASRDEANREQARQLMELQNRMAEKSIKVVKDRRKRNIPAKLIISICICTLLFFSIVFVAVKINEKNIVLNKLDAQYSALEQRRKELEANLDQKNDLEKIEDFAVNTKGMVNTDKVSRQYIYVNKEEKIEVAGQSDLPAEKSTGVFGKLSERIIKAFNDLIYLFN